MLMLMDGMDEIYTVAGLGALAYVGGEVLKKVGQTNFALGLDIIAFFLGFRVVMVVFNNGIRFVEQMFHLM